MQLHVHPSEHLERRSSSSLDCLMHEYIYTRSVAHTGTLKKTRDIIKHVVVVAAVQM